MSRDLTSLTWARETAKRASGAETAWSDATWDAELANHSVERGGATYYNPYAAALVFVLSPNNAVQRSEGSVSETYTPPYLIVQQLEKRSKDWRAELEKIAPEHAFDTTLNITGWG